MSSTTPCPWRSSPLVKPVLTNGWESLLTGTIAIVTGAVLALLFLSSLKEHFGKKKAVAPEPAGLVIPTILSEGNPIDRVKEHSQEKETAAPQRKVWRLSEL